jgi:TonB family protein
MKVVSRKTNSTKSAAKNASSAEAAAQARADAERREAFNTAVRSLRENLTSGTTVEMRGPGGGGPTYANYKQVVGSVYFQAWLVPDDVNTDAATVATVTIRRDGRVESARLIRSSGNAVVDRSVQATLDRVTDIAPFPEGAKEQQRTFTINFNLKAKQLLG